MRTAIAKSAPCARWPADVPYASRSMARPPATSAPGPIPRSSIAPAFASRPTGGIRRLAAGSGIVAMASSLAGCTGQLNATNDLLDAPPLPALAGPLSDEELAAARMQLAAGEPLVSLDRRSWEPVEISVPRGQVEHQPVYWVELMPDRSTARGRGDFPSAGTALEADGDRGAAALEAGTNLVSTPLFALWAPVEMIAEGNWPWTTLRNRPDYARVPPPVARDDWAWVAPPTASITAGGTATAPEIVPASAAGLPAPTTPPSLPSAAPSTLPGSAVTHRPSSTPSPE